jgi:hypothetical protein
MSERFPPITINFTPVKVVGIPGLSLVAIVVAIAVQFPEARWLFFSGLAGGAIVAAVLILKRRRQTPDGGPRDGMLMARDRPSTAQGASSSPSGSTTERASRRGPTEFVAVARQHAALPV